MKRNTTLSLPLALFLLGAFAIGACSAVGPNGEPMQATAGDSGFEGVLDASTGQLRGDEDAPADESNPPSDSGETAESSGDRPPRNYVPEDDRGTSGRDTSDRGGDERDTRGRDKPAEKDTRGKKDAVGRDERDTRGRDKPAEKDTRGKKDTAGRDERDTRGRDKPVEKDTRGKKDAVGRDDRGRDESKPKPKHGRDEETVEGPEKVGIEDSRARETFDQTSVRDLELRVLLDKARREMEAGNLEAADKTLGFSLERDPQSAEAKNLRNEVRLLLSRGGAGGTKDLEKEQLSTLEEYTVEAERVMKSAQIKEDTKDFTGAKQDYSKLLELIRFAPYKAELKERFEAKAKAGMHAAEINEIKTRQAQEAMQRDEAKKLAAVQQDAEDERRRGEIIELWRQAIWNLDLRRFDKAEELLNQILHLDPNFRKAEELRDSIGGLRLESRKRDAYEKRIRGYRAAMLEMDEAKIPDTRLVVYPHGELARRIRERRAHLPGAVSADKSVLAMPAKLDSIIAPVSFHSPDKFIDAIHYIREQAGVNIDFDKEAGDFANNEINIELNSLPLSASFAILLKQQGLRQIYSNGIILIVKDGTDAIKNEDVVTRVHEIRDISYTFKDFTAPILNLRGNSNTPAPPPPPPPPANQAAPDAEAIKTLIQTAVMPDSWDDRHACTAFGGQLVVTHTAQAQAEVKDFLKELRQSVGLLVAMEARFIEIEDDSLSDFGIDFRGLQGPSTVPNQAQINLEDVSSDGDDNAGGRFDNGNNGVANLNPSGGFFFNGDDPRNGPVNFNKDIRGRFENIYDNALGSKLTDIGGLAVQIAYFQNLTQVNAVIRAVQKKHKARTLTAPRLSAYNGRRANLAIMSQIPYISDFTPQVVGSTALADPIMDVIYDGVVLEVVPVISNDRRFITIEVQPTIMEVVRPIATFVTPLGNSAAVTIQIPERRLRQAQTTVRVPDGGAVVIGGLKSSREVEKESTVPILGDIPLIGTLFKRKGKSSEKTTLVIVLKAQILDLNDEELRQPGWH